MDKLKRKIRTLSRLIFGRTAILLLSVLLQLAVIFIGVNFLYRYFAIYYTAFELIGLVVVVHILNESNNASYKMAWIIPVLAFPVFGIVVYLFVNFQVDTKVMRKRLDRINEQLYDHIRKENNYYDRLENEPEGELNLAKYLYNTGSV